MLWLTGYKHRARDWFLSISGKNNNMDHGPGCAMGWIVLPVISTSWLFHLYKSSCYSSTKTLAMFTLTNMSKIQNLNIKSSTIFQPTALLYLFAHNKPMPKKEAMGVVLGCRRCHGDFQVYGARQLLRN